LIHSSKKINKDKNLDGYKPVHVPKALKVFYGGENSTKQEETNLTEITVNSKLIDNRGLKSVSYLQVPVKNLEESTDWYVGNLGFKVHWKRPDNKMTILALPSGPSIFLCETELFHGRMSVVIGFEAVDIRKLLSDLQSKEVQIGEIRENRGVVKGEILAMDFDFFDPSGNMLVAHGTPQFIE
jgi:catechol 2,3-dioxygenase-like lactoylglutathione lyase family enzyme